MTRGIEFFRRAETLRDEFPATPWQPAILCLLERAATLYYFPAVHTLTIHYKNAMLAAPTVANSSKLT